MDEVLESSLFAFTSISSTSFLFTSMGCCSTGSVECSNSSALSSSLVSFSSILREASSCFGDSSVEISSSSTTVSVSLAFFANKPNRGLESRFRMLNFFSGSTLASDVSFLTFLALSLRSEIVFCRKNDFLVTGEDVVVVEVIAPCSIEELTETFLDARNGCCLFPVNIFVRPLSPLEVATADAAVVVVVEAVSVLTSSESLSGRSVAGGANVEVMKSMIPVTTSGTENASDMLLLTDTLMISPSSPSPAARSSISSSSF